MRVWAAAPQGAERRRWNALRLTLLHQVWEARCAAASVAPSARDIVTATIAAVRAAIAVHYARTHGRVHMESDLPARILSHRPLAAAASATADFTAVWAVAGLCTLQPPGQPGGPQRLVLQLSVTHPVVAPLPAPAGLGRSAQPGAAPPAGVG
jgi:hypothetical protein